MTTKQMNKLIKIMNPPKCNNSIEFLTVKEYIERFPESITNRRVSAKGNEVVEVTYPTGNVKEYPISHIDRTTAFEN